MGFFTHMARALQAKHSTKCRFVDAIFDVGELVRNASDDLLSTHHGFGRYPHFRRDVDVGVCVEVVLGLGCGRNPQRSRLGS
jgi:hypothetical protein